MQDNLIHSLFLNTRGLVSIVGAGGKTSLMFRLARQLSDSGKTVLTTTTTKIFFPTKEQSPDTLIVGSFDKLLQKSKDHLTRHPHFSAGSYHDKETGKITGISPELVDPLWRTELFDWIIVEADGARCTPLKATGLHEPVLPKETTHLILVTGLDAVGTPLDDQHVHRAQIFSQNTDLPLGDPVDEQSIATSIAIEIKKAIGLCHPEYTIVVLNKADTRDRIAIARKIGALLLSNENIDTIVTVSLNLEPPVKDCLKPEKNKPKEI